jgi:predicted O-methyltransferase YrrM
MKLYRTIFSPVIVLFIFVALGCNAQTNDQEKIDQQVQAFLDKHSGRWYDMNVPSSDGKLLYDLIIENNYTSALEIGTSTGHSGIWMAWALSKTGGKLVTIELDESRHKEALANFKEAGVAHLIDARLGDAHELVPALEGPFDFVFSDADKYWYKNYFLAVDPKLKVNGCYTSHNVSDRQGRGGNQEYLQFLLDLDQYETKVDNRGGGMAISFKKADQ